MYKSVDRVQLADYNIFSGDPHNIIYLLYMTCMNQSSILNNILYELHFDNNKKTLIQIYDPIPRNNNKKQNLLFRFRIL